MMPSLFGALDGATIRTRVHRVILAGPRSTLVTPLSSILFDYSVMGEKKASERARRGKEEEGDETRRDETKGRYEVDRYKW